MKKSEEFFKRIEGSLIVSCQALEDEPLHGSHIMAKMAVAACEGGAVAIRANGEEDIEAIKKAIDLPVIGLVKQDYSNSEIYITPTQKEVNELIDADVDMVAIDSTARKRPNDEWLQDLFKSIQASGKLVMADVSTREEGVMAEKLGADCIGTTLSGYTSYSPKQSEPDFSLIKNLKGRVSIPVIAEGRYWQGDQVKKALQLGAHAVVIGSAITRPQLITKHFVDSITTDWERRDV